MKQSIWRIWAKSLGQKDGRDNREADKIAIIRTLIMFQLIMTNFFIIAGNIKHLSEPVVEPTQGTLCSKPQSYILNK